MLSFIVSSLCRKKTNLAKTNGNMPSIEQSTKRYPQLKVCAKLSSTFTYKKKQQIKKFITVNMSCHQLNYRLVVLALLFITLVGAKRTSSKIKEEDLNCDTKNNDKIDRKMAQVMVFGEHGRKYPEDRKQLKNFCE